MTVGAPAKVNLALEVLGLLEGGYHELDTVFCTLELHDTLEWHEGGEGFGLELSGMDSGLEVETGEGNLVTRALRLLEAEVGHPLPGRVRLTKRIPAGGGLGGGSADAAALLHALGGRLGLSSARVQELAASLGADVAFLVRGGTARGTARGEQLEPLPAPAPLPVVLAFPAFGCPTGAVYRCWDEHRFRPARGASARVCEALAKGDSAALVDSLANDLEPAARQLFPDLEPFFSGLRDAGCDAVLLAGSGSTVLGVVREGDPEAVAARARERFPRVVVTRLQGAPR